MKKRKNPKLIPSIIIVVLGFLLLFFGKQDLLFSELNAFFPSEDLTTESQNNQHSSWVSSASETSSGLNANIINSLSRHAARNFREAKLAAKKIYADHRSTFYCGCRFDQYGNIDLKSCGYKVQRDLQRAQQLEWEHIVPVSQIASHLPCWQQKQCRKGNGESYKGRECCRDMDKMFAIMEADLHNIVPEVGELNACRSNFRFGMLPYIKPGQFGECDFKLDKENRRVEPKRELRGAIARTYLYVAERYGVRLSDSQLQLFKAWNKELPPDAWEVERDKRIAKIQGNHNSYIVDYNKQR